MAAETVHIAPINLYAVLPIFRCNYILHFSHVVIHMCLNLIYFLSILFYNLHNYLHLKGFPNDFITQIARKRLKTFCMQPLTK